MNRTENVNVREEGKIQWGNGSKNLQHQRKSDTSKCALFTSSVYMFEKWMSRNQGRMIFTRLLQNCCVGCQITSFMVTGKLNCLYKYLQTNMYTSLCQKIKPVFSSMSSSRHLMSPPWSPGCCKIRSSRTCDIASETVRFPFDHSRYIECPGWKINLSEGSFASMPLNFDKVTHLSRVKTCRP